MGLVAAASITVVSPIGAQDAPPGSCLEELETLEIADSGAYGLAIDPSNGLVYVAMDGLGRVDVIDPVSNAVINSIEVPDTSVGFPLVDAATNTLYVSSFSSDAVYAIDLATEALVGTIAVTEAQQLALNSVTGLLYASGQSNNVVVIDTATRSSVGSIDVGGTSLGVEVDETNNRVFVGDFTNDTLDVFDGEALTLIDSWPLGGDEPITLRFDQTTGNVWVTTRVPGAVTEMDPDDGSDGVDFAFAEAQSLAILPSIGQGYVGPSNGTEMRVFSLDDGSAIETFPVGARPLSIAARVDPVRIYVSGLDDGTVTVIGDVPPCPQFPTTTTTTSTSTSTTSTTVRAATDTVRPRFAG
jgi:DNA-binding beta-propeller fold protein YncE